MFKSQYKFNKMMNCWSIGNSAFDIFHKFFPFFFVFLRPKTQQQTHRCRKLIFAHIRVCFYSTSVFSYVSVFIFSLKCACCSQRYQFFFRIVLLSVLHLVCVFSFSVSYLKYRCILSVRRIEIIIELTYFSLFLCSAVYL